MGQGESFVLQNSSGISISNDSDSLVQVFINDVMYKVTCETPLETSLNTFIRNKVGLKGTKSMCHEGGCGICIVTAEINGQIMAVNSCLVPVIICDGWKITTIEKVGNRVTGYHKLQTALAEANGSQCGYCSPGWIMSMFSLLANGEMSMAEIENSFASNLCRCTGYRPILETFKNYKPDAPPKNINEIKDIEDLHNTGCVKNLSNALEDTICSDMCMVYQSSVPRTLKLNFPDSRNFFKVLTIDTIFVILSNIKDKSYIINGGNTSHGVYSNKDIQIIIDINDVPDLHKIEKEGDTLVFGANVTLSNAKIAFEKYSSEPGFHYFKNMAEHLDQVASIPIRNIGTLAGNLMIKNQHHEFPSDVFLILETAGVKLHILSSPGSKTSISLMEFLTFDMRDKLIYSIVFPQLSKEYVYRSYKIMPRAQNSHAILNAGFLFKLDNNGKVLEKPNIIYGGVNPNFLHALKTEEFLVGKSIFNVGDLKAGLNILNSEIDPENSSTEHKPDFLKTLATNLFYKFVLSVNPAKVKPKLQSGGTMLRREVSSGKQILLKPVPNLYPVSQPIPQLNAIHQTSGESEYTNDIPIRSNEVFCAFAIAEVPGVIESIDFEEAMSSRDVITFITAKDIIKGNNMFVGKKNKMPQIIIEDELLLAEAEIKYAGQPYGIIVAGSQSAAVNAAAKVKVQYSEKKTGKPIITIQDAIASKDQSRILKKFAMKSVLPPGKDVEFTVKGNYETGSQYHFCMETQICVCVPVDNGIEVYSATQWPDLTQTSISNLLGLPMNAVNVKVRKLGGGFGAKISRATQIACACALACFKTNRPSRMVLSIEDEMRIVGKRNSSYLEYEVGVDSIGRIQYLNMTCWCNVGASFNESCALKLVKQFVNCYDLKKWSVAGYDVKTDIPSNTWCRAPGALEGLSMIEHIMEHIARETDKDSLDVKVLNLDEVDLDVLTTMITQLKANSNYEMRMEDIERFNYFNRWKKRALSTVLMCYKIQFFGNYHAFITVYPKDGTIYITHGGVEMGQGLNTKVAQLAAKTLKVDIQKIKIGPTTTIDNPNDGVTGNAMNTDSCGKAVLMVCDIIVKRLEPIRKNLDPKASWETIVSTAYAQNINLTATTMSKAQDIPNSYKVYGTVMSEVEIDVLTGQHIVRRVDIHEDAGEVVLNPKIDVGQIEGGFVMGMGYWTCEDLFYDPETGALKNFRTWNYKIPGAKDIPVDFRVSFAEKDPMQISDNPVGIEKSRATSEPPICLSCSIPLAIREAINTAREEAGNKDPWYQLDNTLTVEKILLSCLTNIDDMIL